MKSPRFLLQRCFPILYCQSIEELIESAVLIPDLRNIRHTLRMTFLAFFFFVTFVSGLRVQLFKGYSFWVNDSLGFTGKIALGGVAAFINEYISTRVWLFSRHKSRKMGFLHLAKQVNENELARLLPHFRVAAINVFITGTSVMLAHVSYQFINEPTTQGKITLVIFFIIWFIFIILNSNDMLIMYFIALLGVLVIRRRIIQLRSRLNLIISPVLGIVYEVTYLKKSMQQMLQITQSVRHLNSLVVCLMATNRMVVAPTASIAVYLFFAGLGHGVSKVVRIIFAICFAVYVTRGYVLTLFLSIISVESRKLHNNLASIVANRNVSLLSKIQLLQVMQNLDETRSQYLVRDTTGPITRLDVLESILVTFQFTILLFDFGRKLE